MFSWNHYFWSCVVFGICLFVSSCRTKKLASVETTCASLSTSSDIELELSVPPLPANINLPDDSTQNVCAAGQKLEQKGTMNHAHNGQPLKIRIRARASAGDSIRNIMNHRPIDIHAAEPIFANGSKNPLDTWFTYFVLIILALFALRFLKKS